MTIRFAHNAFQPHFPHASTTPSDCVLATHLSTHLFLKMSALQACGLHVGSKIFLRWDPLDFESPMVLGIISCVELLEDMNPSRLSVHVVRQHRTDDCDNAILLTIQQHDPSVLPALIYTQTGGSVAWSLPSGSVIKALGAVRSSSPISKFHQQ